MDEANTDFMKRVKAKVDGFQIAKDEKTENLWKSKSL
jgi:hypothetical protein